ncbi:MAG: hypothetical protein KJ888_21095 [Gammaproteobacteria bacterium]|nr:hypothetical protein [Gammaproteobacteria bacterium]
MTDNHEVTLSGPALKRAMRRMFPTTAKKPRRFTQRAYSGSVSWTAKPLSGETTWEDLQLEKMALAMRQAAERGRFKMEALYYTGMNPYEDVSRIKRMFDAYAKQVDKVCRLKPVWRYWLGRLCFWKH